MTAIIPRAQDTQLDLRATNAKEFRELLDRIRDAAGLTCGQIATKTRMPRSTAYALVDTNRPGLPSNENQIRAFVEACGLTATQADNVRDLWLKLHNEQENAKNAVKAAEARSKLPTLRSGASVEDLLVLGVAPDAIDRAASDKVAFGHFAASCDHSPKRVTTPLDLVHYILADEYRYQRAFTLVKLLSALAFVFVTGVVVIAVLIPSTASYLGTGLVAVLLVAARALNGKRLRIRFPKDAGPR